MNPRQQELLNEIIVRYTDTAQPVSSLQVAGAGNFDVSPATIRNDMASLEDEGYIMQPHTSSGRVPTEKGYRHFIQHSLQQRQLAARQRQVLDEVAAARAQYHNALKELAKTMATMSSSASFFSTAPHETYVTGLGNVLSQPEFSEQGLAQQLAASVDRFDDLIDNFGLKETEQVAILIGSENPLNPNCATLVVRYKSPHGQGIVGLLGPVRMDYARNAAILRHAQQLIHLLVD
jgi:transcriptional regulator of heat shock response